MIRRPRRTIPATVVALFLLAAAVVVVVCCVQILTGRPPLVPTGTVAEVGALTLADPAVVAAGAVLVVIGLVLLVSAIRPGNPRVLALSSTNELTDAGVTRHTLARDLTRHAERADGITDASVVVTARRVRVSARTPLRDQSDLADRVRQLVGDRLEDINLARPPRVRVAVSSDRNAR